MIKIFKFIEYAYLAVALFFITMAVVEWRVVESKSLLYLILAGAACFMFFFKRSLRKRIEKDRKPE